MNKLSILITSLLCCLAVSISAQSIVGKWKFEFPSDQGTMIMSANIKADGTYALDFGNDGSAEVTGKYTQNGDQFTVSDDAGYSRFRTIFGISCGAVRHKIWVEHNPRGVFRAVGTEYGIKPVITHAVPTARTKIVIQISTDIAYLKARFPNYVLNRESLY